MIPLWEVLASDATENGEPATALEPAIGTLPTKINDAANGLEGFVDCSLLEPTRRMNSGEHPIEWLCRESAAKGTSLTPIVCLDSDTDYVEAAKAAHAALGCDVGVRLTIADLSEISDIRDLITGIGLQHSSLHLVVDCEHLVYSVAQMLPIVLPPLINPVLSIGAWKTVTLLSGAIPEDYSSLPPDQLSLISRSEWPLWNALVTKGVLTRRPAFGDYAVAHAVYRFTPWWMGASSAAKIRYTGLNDYHIFRGRSLKIPKYHKFAQFYNLAAQVVAHAVFRGAQYSAGDACIANCAVHNGGTGNLQTWVFAATNQHVTFVGRLVPTIP